MKINKNLNFVAGLFLLLLFNACSSAKQNATGEIQNLRVEYQVNPVGIDVEHPRFSWEMVSGERGAMQTAYQIKVYDDYSCKHEVWNSGKVISGQSLPIKYQGAPLKPSTRYYWKVQVWNEDKNEIAPLEDAYFETGLLNTSWGDARWIQKEGNVKTEQEGIPYFRKTFTLSKKIKLAQLYTSALGVYDLFLNGKSVGQDELKPGWTNYFKTLQYNTYDVTTLLNDGSNALGASVSSGWWAGGISHGEYKSENLAFIAQLKIEYVDGSSQIIVTDSTWKSSTHGAVRSGDIYDGETYDARLESNWTSPSYNDSNWKSVIYNHEFKGQLTALVGPSVKMRPELNCKPIHITVYHGTRKTGTTHDTINVVEAFSHPQMVKLKKGETVVYDLGQNMAGWVNFTVQGAAGTQMKLRFAEMLNDNGAAERGNDGPGGSLFTANLRSAKATLRYILKGDVQGETFHPSHTFFGFRYCEVTATDNIQIQSLIGEVVGTVAEESATLETSNALVNKLYSNVLWGQRSNFLSIPTDCPQRDERLGWMGDAEIFCRAASYNANVAVFYQKWMRDVRNSQREDGAYPSVAPHSWVGYGQAAWAEAGLIVPWTVYLMFNNKDIISENYTSMEKYMEFLSKNVKNGYKYNGAGTDYGDWLAYEPTASQYISVCYYAYAAELMVKMSHVLSKQAGDEYAQKESAYQQLFQNIKREFQMRYLNNDATLKQNTQTAYLLALKLNLFANRQQENSAVEHLNAKIEANGNKLSTGFLGTGIINQTLSRFGKSNTAYRLLLQRENPSWLYSVDQGATTIWERWDSYTKEQGFNKDGMNSFNHYSYGAVAEWMFRYMAGIDLDEKNPGFKHILLHPIPDIAQVGVGLSEDQQIRWVKASYRSCYGLIKSAWKLKPDNRIVYSVTIPANTTATLTLPFIAPDDQIIEGGNIVKNKGGVVELQSGNYTFEVVKK